VNCEIEWQALSHLPGVADDLLGSFWTSIGFSLFISLFLKNSSGSRSNNSFVYNLVEILKYDPIVTIIFKRLTNIYFYAERTIPLMASLTLLNSK
jgi:hypothetical protein